MASVAAPASERRAGAREWLGLAVLALPTMLLALDNNVLFLALPHLAADLAPSSTQLLWITDIYGFMIAGFLVTMGALGDRIGRRRLLVIGAAAFGAASVLAAFSTSAEMLILTRALLGVAGATLMPSTLALIGTMFTDPRQRGTAVAVWMSAFLTGGAIAPIVGGAMLEHFWWGSVFLMGLPVMVALLAAAPVLLPEHRDAGTGPPDLTSVALSLVAILAVVYGLKELAADGVGVRPATAVAVGVVVGLAFLRRQRRLPDPLVDLRLFAGRSFVVALGVLLLGTLVMSGALLFVTQYLQLVQGLSALRAGLWLLLSAAGLAVGSLLTPRLSRRVRPVVIVATAFVVSAAGFGLLALVDADGGMVLLLVGFGVVSVGLSPLAVLSTDLVVGSAPPEHAGSAASLSETSGELGVAMGVALLGGLGTAVYRGRIADTLPTDMPAGAAEAAGDTLAGAVAAAERLPARYAAELVEPAREAFVSGLNVVAVVSAAAAVVFAALAIAVLRRAGSGAETANSPSPN